MAIQDNEASPQETAQYITTEHFTLQTARSGVLTDINGRTNLFIGAVSSAVVALAFIGQVSRLGDTFFTFALVLFPALVFLGIVTYLRVTQSSIEDSLYAREINRIRHFYAERSPRIGAYFLLSTHDDAPGTLYNMGLQSTRGQVVFSNAGTISVINSILVGVLVGLLVNRLLVSSSLLSAVCGIVAFLISLIVHLFYQSWNWQRTKRNMHILFPSDGK